MQACLYAWAWFSPVLPVQGKQWHCRGIPRALTITPANFRHGNECHLYCLTHAVGVGHSENLLDASSHSPACSKSRGECLHVSVGLLLREHLLLQFS
eukprot:1143539-Pelagomonas_calceolata.AAC.4